jgi:hypothetical protein
LAYGVLLLLVWSMLCGDLWALQAATAVASFTIQTHVGFVVLALPVCALGLGFIVYQNRPRASWGRLLRAVLLSAAIAFVMWLPPIIDQIENAPGNLRLIVHYFHSPDGPIHSLGVGWRVVTGEFGAVPEWIVGARPNGVMGLHPFAATAPLPLLLVPFLVAVVVAWRRRDRSQRALALTLTVALVSGVIAVMRTIGLIEAYRLRWTWLVAMLAMVFSAWIGWTAVAARRPELQRRVLMPVAIGIIAVATAFSLVDAARAGQPQPVWSTPTDAVVPPLLRALPDRPGVVLVRRPDAAQFWWPGVVLALARRGIPVRVDRDPQNLLGKHFIGHGEPVRAVVTITMDDKAFVDQPGARRVALWTQCPDARVQSDLARAKVDAQNYQAGHMTPAQYLSEIRSLCTSAVGVFLQS